MFLYNVLKIRSIIKSKKLLVHGVGIGNPMNMVIVCTDYKTKTHNPNKAMSIQFESIPRALSGLISK